MTRYSNKFLPSLHPIISKLPGHLMGKKSLQGLNSDYLTPTETTMVTQMDRYQGLFEALMQQKNQQRQMVPKAADRRLRSGWRDESTHVREVGV